MSAHRKIRYAGKARNDLASIAAYTREEWGEGQRDRYLALLRRGMEPLATFSELGELRPDLGEGVRSLRIEMHVVFYRVTPTSILVLRLRHVRASDEYSADL